MPLSSAKFQSQTSFAYSVSVTNWAALTQGTNAVQFGGDAIDTSVWNQAYASAGTLAGGASLNIDLKNFTSLAGEAGLALTAVLGITVTVSPASAGAPSVGLTVGPGVSNGLEWLAGANPITLGSTDNFTRYMNPAGSGFAVDATHKTLTVTNTGGDTANYTIVIVGKV